MMARRRRRKGEGHATRLEILAAAAGVLREEGVAGFTIRRIGARCGCSSAAMYHHFADKQSLFEALLDREVAALHARLAAWVRADMAPDARLASAVRDITDFARRQPFLICGLLRDPQPPAAVVCVEALAELAGPGAGRARRLWICTLSLALAGDDEPHEVRG